MSKATFSHQILRSAFVLTALFSATSILNAQTTTQTSSTVPAAQVSFQVPAMDTSKDALFSSSATENQDAPVVEASLVPTTPNFAEMMQYGGRARGGRPRYRGANTNPDGSNKWTFYGGAGFAQPVGNTFHYLTPSYGFQVGGGRQFDQHFALPIEFDFDHFDFTGETLSNQSILYFGDANPSDNGLDGTSHVWSFSVDPTYTLFNGENSGGGFGAYVVAGVGFYHKTANFTVPGTGYYFDYFCGCYIPYTANETIDKYTSNAPGFSGGFGLTYKFSRFSNERFYGEVRYVFVDNSQRAGYTVANEATTTYSGNNAYPANSNRTTYIPVKFGIRF